MFEYHKIVINGVSDNERLFKKELIKSLNWISPSEQPNFKDWVKEKYYEKYPDIIEHVFNARNMS